MFKSILQDKIILSHPFIEFVICSVVIIMGLQGPFRDIFMGLSVVFDVSLAVWVIKLLKKPGLPIMPVIGCVLVIAVAIAIASFRMYCLSNMIFFHFEPAICE
jgi:hypothetical protein